MRGPLILANEAWQYTRKHLALFAAIYAVPLVAGVVLGFVSVVVFPGTEDEMVTTSLSLPVALSLFLVTLLVTVLVSIAGSLALMKAIITPGGSTLRSAYRYGFAHFLSFLVLSMLVGLATTLGFILLIIPGIIVSVWFAFAQMVFVQEGLRGTAAMRASREYVRGRWWAVFGRLAALIIIVIALYAVIAFFAQLIAPGQTVVQDVVIALCNLVAIPWSIVYVYFMYQDLRGAAMTKGPIA